MIDTLPVASIARVNIIIFERQMRRNTRQLGRARRHDILHFLLLLAFLCFLWRFRHLSKVGLWCFWSFRRFFLSIWRRRIAAHVQTCSLVIVTGDFDD